MSHEGIDSNNERIEKKRERLQQSIRQFEQRRSPRGSSDRTNQDEPRRKSRGRVDIIRNTTGRGGKVVTVVKNFAGIGLPEKEKLAKEMQKVCGVGGTVKDGRIEIQGDKREEVDRILTDAGFTPVFAGG